MAENTKRNRPAENNPDHVTREEFNRLKDKVDNHGNRLDNFEGKLDEVNRTVTNIRVDISPIATKIDNLMDSLNRRDERHKENLDLFKELLDDHKSHTSNQLKIHAENISKLEPPKKRKNLFEFWTTNEGIMVSLITGGVAIITILIEVFMK